MFKFKRQGKQIRLEILPRISGAETWSFYFSREENDEPGAQLLLNAFETRMKEALKNTRQEFYDRGYKDGKAKRRKCDWIGGWW